MSSDRERLLEYRRRVQARYAPVVTVVTTPAVDASCAASGLTFADLLRPFCELRGLDVPMRHNPEAPPTPSRSSRSGSTAWRSVASPPRTSPTTT